MNAIINARPVSGVRTNIEDAIQSELKMARTRPEWSRMEVVQNIAVLAVLAAAAASYISAVL